MEGVTTNSLRALAPKWSLAGDDQLLNLLQNTHQRIISRCQDVNSKLEEMASTLDDANINLQNVNNKFMALSNSQFIESRVYDDDADLDTTDIQPVQEVPQPPAADEIIMLKSSLAILERAYETAEIIDDSDSDSDAEIRVVLKAKDMYSHRPLPYIIGSQPWKNKWHAGLIIEDSDSDSCTSKQDREIEQYSESEEESTRPPLEENTLSESSASLPGSLGAPSLPPSAAGAPVAARPADIAAALAKRLAGDSAHVVQEEAEEYSPAEPTQPRKIYRPDQPASSAIFSDEPPPLEESSDQSSDEDIFAEINKHTPYTQRNKVASNLADDLFAFDKPTVEQGDIFNDFAPTQGVKQLNKPKSTLLEGESEPELFTEPTKKEIHSDTVTKDEPSSKKPVGGISLFGSNKGAQSIGAAILKRNLHKSSISSDESGSDDAKNRTENIKKQLPDKPNVPAKNDKTEHKNNTRHNIDDTDNKSVAKKDIFDDLFSKSVKVQNKTQIAKEPIKVSPVKEKERTSVKDLFSDNLFDDIDDIFTSNVKIPTKESNQKSIFDDDDLFSDFDATKTINQNKDNKPRVKKTKTNTRGNKSIFESDDELFSDIKTDSDKQVTKNVESHTKKNIIKTTNENTDSTNTKIEDIKTPTETIKERNLFDDSPQVVKPDAKPKIKSKSIFDSDSDDDIFAKLKSDNETTNISKNVLSYDNNTVGKEESNVSKNQHSIENFTTKDKILIQSPSLFEEDEIDDLFIASNKLKSGRNQSNDTNEAKVKHLPSFEKESVIENASRVQENDNLNQAHYGKDKLSKNTKDPEPDSRPNSEPKLDQNVTTNKSVVLDEGLLTDNLLSTTKEVTKNTFHKQIPDIVESYQKEESKAGPILQHLGIDDIKNMKAKTESDNIHKPEKENMKQSDVVDIIGPAKDNAISVLNADIFDDIFTEPPAFEKPAEPKKSKNVNALFDDDSDDESLFFKKDDVISDEKPDIFSKNANFDIFVDEPPDDIDFITKPAKNTDIDTNLFSSVLKTNESIQSTKSVNDEEVKEFRPMQEKEKLPKFSGNADNGHDLLSSRVNKHSVPKSIKIDKNEDFMSVPKTQENVPVNVKLVEENTIDDIIFNEVPETPTQDNLLDRNKTNNLLIPATDKNTDGTVEDKINVSIKDIDSDEELFASLPNLPKSSPKFQADVVKPHQNDVQSNVEDSKSNEFDDIFISESPKKEPEIKKIGKINTKNFNINVNALMPGASPKKILKEHKDEEKSEISEPNMFKIIPDETYFEPKTTSNKVENNLLVSNIKSSQIFTDETDLKPKAMINIDKNKAIDKTVKSITFDEKSESEVLDNNASKQRPRIQVKRRPSSRKARHEAVRKSAIDFSDDTDNSSSFDEPKAINISKDDKTKQHENLSEKESIINEENNIDKEGCPSIESQKDKMEITKEQINNAQKEHITEEKSDIFDSLHTNVPSRKDSELPPVSKEIKEPSRDLQSVTVNKQTTTKIVYILNDEDIFNTDSNNTEKRENVLNNKDSENPGILKNTEGITTLGKTYKEDLEKKSKEEFTAQSTTQEEMNSTKDHKSSKNNKTTLFDDSDAELFKKSKKIVKKTTIFDSDSEEDLFSSKRNTEKKNKEVKNKEVKERKEVVVKGSLFGDEDDDDDLFGVNISKNESKPKSVIPSTSKEAFLSATTASKPAEPVFNDPLSMLGDDD